MTKPAPTEIFGDTLTQVMRARGISQTALGELVGRAQTTVSEWVRGQAEPLPSTVFTIEQTLGLAPGQLSRHLGYVPLSVLEEGTAVEVALRTDPTLDEPVRQAMLAGYRAYQQARRELLDGALLRPAPTTRRP